MPESCRKCGINLGPYPIDGGNLTPILDLLGVGGYYIPTMSFPELAGEPKVCSRCVFTALTGEFRDYSPEIKAILSKKESPDA